MKLAVFSLGGSLIVPDKIDLGLLNRFSKLTHKLINENFKLIIVTGGGKTSRDYIKAVKTLTTSTNSPARVGIEATRLNARLVHEMLHDISYPKIITNPAYKVRFKKVLVAAGWKPGFSSDFVAVMLAKTYNCKKVINLTDVDYVYTKNPKKYKDAKRLPALSWKEYLQIINRKWEAGLSFPFDPVAGKLAYKNRIEVAIINGKKLNQVKNYLDNKKFTGTIIK